MRRGKPLQATLDKIPQSQGNVRNTRARLTKLRDERPNLAEFVSTEVLPLDDALKKEAEEAMKRKDQRWAATMNLIDNIRSLDKPPETAPDDIAFYDAAVTESRVEKARQFRG